MKNVIRKRKKENSIQKNKKQKNEEREVKKKKNKKYDGIRYSAHNFH